MKFCLWPFCFLCFLSYKVLDPPENVHGQNLNTLMFSLFDGVEFTQEKLIWKITIFSPDMWNGPKVKTFSSQNRRQNLSLLSTIQQENHHFNTEYTFPQSVVMTKP